MRRFCILLLLMLIGVTLSAQEQRDLKSFQADYTRLYKNYVQHPNDVKNLLDLCTFYSQPENPMFSLALAMKYVSNAEEEFVKMIEDKSRYKEAKKVVGYKISLASIRQQKQQIIEQTRQYITENEVGAVELTNIAASFKSVPEIAHMAEGRRIASLLEDMRQEGSLQAYKTFIEKYPKTNESEAAQREMIKLATKIINEASTEAEIDSLMKDYSQYEAIERAAKKRKASLAYLAVKKINNAEAYRNFISKYPYADENNEALDALETFRESEYAHLKTARQLADFALKNDDSPLAEQALVKLRAMVRNQHDQVAARIYFDNFPLDVDFGNLYKLYYSWVSEEGCASPIEKFQKENPNFPYMMATHEELRQARVRDSVNLLLPYDEDDFSNFANKLRSLNGKRIAFVALQRCMQPFVKEKKWEEAVERMEYFKFTFEDVAIEEYKELMAMVKAPVNKKRALVNEVVPAYKMTNSALHPNGKHLYYNQRKADGHTIISVAQIVTDKDKDYKWKGIGPCKFDNLDNRDIYFYSLFDNGKKMMLGKNGDIMIAELTNNIWHVSEVLPAPVNTEYREYDATMLPDGSGILFASDRPNGHNYQPSGTYFHGDTALASDLYFAPRTLDGWGQPVNLGININTAYCEHAPVISRDLKTLYFISDGYAGFGFGDVMMATRSDVNDWTSWSKPENYGKETNSSFDEGTLTMTADEKQLFICSNRSGRYGCYSVATSHKASTSQVDFTISTSSQSLDIDVIDWGSKSVCVKTSIEVDNPLKIQLHKEKNFAVMAQPSSDFFTPTICFDIKSGSNIELTSIAATDSLADSIPLAAITFEEGTSIPTPYAIRELNSLVQFLAAHPERGKIYLYVNVMGGDDKLCYDLSYQRGLYIKTYLEQHGIEQGRVLCVNYGNVNYKAAAKPKAEIECRF